MKKTRKENVLDMQITLIPILLDAWKVNLLRLHDIFVEYDVLNYIDVCYEMYNSVGNQGIIEDLEEYIEMQGVL